MIDKLIRQQSAVWAERVYTRTEIIPFSVLWRPRNVYKWESGINWSTLAWSISLTINNTWLTGKYYVSELGRNEGDCDPQLGGIHFDSSDCSIRFQLADINLRTCVAASGIAGQSFLYSCCWSISNNRPRVQLYTFRRVQWVSLIRIWFFFCCCQWTRRRRRRGERNLSQEWNTITINVSCSFRHSSLRIWSNKTGTNCSRHVPLNCQYCCSASILCCTSPIKLQSRTCDVLVHV